MTQQTNPRRGDDMKIGSYTIVPAGDEHDEYFLVTYAVRNDTSMTVQVSVSDLETALATLFIQSDNDSCWINRTINDLFYASQPNKDIVEGLSEVRNPTLTHEDILDLGWGFVKKCDDETFGDLTRHNEYKLKNDIQQFWTLYWFYDANKNIMIDIPIGDSFEFTIQTRLELQDLMRMLGIKS